MRRALVVFAVAGCGSVNATPDGRGGAPDADLLGNLRTGCVLMAHMDEAVWTGAPGEVRDDCGGDDNGTLTGHATTVPDGVRGRAGSFAGDACIDVPDSPALHATTGLTLSAWVKPTALNGTDANGVISKRVAMGVESAYSMYVWTAYHVWVDLDGENDRFAGTDAIANGAWQQLTVSYDGTRAAAQRVRVFVNGALDTTHAETSATLTQYTSPLHIGCMPASTTQQNFIGLLDEVVVWSRALSDSEIVQWYTMTQPNP